MLVPGRKKMMNNFFRVVLTLALALGLSTALTAKGETSRITIAGSRLTNRLEITDPKVLKDFQVWSGPGTTGCIRDKCSEGTRGFIVDWPSGDVAQRPDGLPRYEVSFYATDVRVPGHQTERLVYVVFYEYDPSASQGYVYLPGKGEPWYQLNTRSIFRGREGRWFRATPAWQRPVVPLIAPREIVLFLTTDAKLIASPHDTAAGILHNFNHLLALHDASRLV
jgi:hypothetical protein